MRRSIPKFVEEMLAAPPRAGAGLHRWLFTAARQLHAHLPAGEIVNQLLNRVQGCGRHVSRKEIELESETFSPGNQGFRLRFNRAIWMASPIHWSVERLRDL